MISVRNAFIALLLLIPAALFAQSYHGEVRGLVADPSGSVLIGAKVTLIDESRKLTQDAVSDSSGQYAFTRVDPSTYQIVVEAAGFKRFSREGIVVGTQQSVTVDVALSVGDIAQTVQRRRFLKAKNLSICPHRPTAAATNIQSSTCRKTCFR
jgi:hypothetical protein